MENPTISLSLFSISFGGNVGSDATTRGFSAKATEAHNNRDSRETAKVRNIFSSKVLTLQSGNAGWTEAPFTIWAPI